MNPRRPTPSGPEPDPLVPASIAFTPHASNGFPSNKPDDYAAIGGNSYGGQNSEEELKRFFVWCVEKGTSENTCRQYVRYLRKPLDPHNKWSRLAWKAFYKFKGDEEKWRSIKVKKSGVDLYVPSDEDVLNALRRACMASQELCWVYKLLVYSGLRLEEAVKVIKEQQEDKWVRLGGFWKYPLAWKRGSKQALYCYTIEKPPRMLVSAKWVSNWASKNSALAPKYIRKWVATKMLSLGVPEEIVNFIQGRVPQEVLSKHYLKLSALADQFYMRYAEWLHQWLAD